MLPFFRKIRYKLAKDNQFFKYSRYAIGEIVLVVVGILIALYINNWNEKRKEREKFDAVLIEVEKELISNIKEVRSVLEYYHFKDSLISIFFYDTLTIEDYKRNPDFMNLCYNSNTCNINDGAYQKILGHSEGLLPKQDSIINNLKHIYSTIKVSIDHTDELMFSYVIEANRYQERFSWYKDSNLGIFTDEMYKFFLNDPMYENHVSTWVTFGLLNQTQAIEDFDIEGRRTYKKIHNYLKVITTQYKDTLMFEYDPILYSQYDGTYIPYWYSNGSEINIDSIVVSNESDKKYLAFYLNNGIIDKEEIIPVERHYFRTEHKYGFFSNVFDSKENVTGLNFSTGNFMAKLKKIH